MIVAERENGSIITFALLVKYCWPVKERGDIQNGGRANGEREQKMKRTRRRRRSKETVERVACVLSDN